MKEMQIQLYWLNHSISLSNLVTTEGKKLVILFPGHLNLNQGPDFLHGKILIENVEWVGSVEVHHKCSDWYLHNHASDTHYQNFILHVIWENDCKNFEHCQVLELSRYITSEKIQSLEQNNNTGFFLTNDLSFQMLEQLGLERVERKSNEVLIQVRAKGGDWDFVFWKRMAYSFGLPLNGNEFERMMDDAYEQFKPEKIIYGSIFNSITNSPFYLISSFRSRPQNSPLKRLTQLSTLMISNRHLFRNVLEEPNLNILYKANFRSEFSWCFYQRMVINTFVPVLLAYSKFTGNINHRTKAVKWLSDLPPEDNAYTRDFINKNFKPTSALQSQGIIEYCMKKN